MRSLHRLAHADTIDWAALYGRAVAAGCERAVSRDEERLAAPDELLARVPAELVYLSELATLSEVSPCPHMVAPPLARQAGGPMRLLDRALAAHGRDNGYATAAWRQHACRAACAAAELFEHGDGSDWPLAEAVARSALRVGRASSALHRDRLGVPEELAEAIGPLLAIYAVAAAG